MTRFRTILIANRGEIAGRIQRTARKLGYRTVAIYSPPDRTSPWVQAADLAVPLAGATPRESYLDGEAIVEAARRAGAEAIHPGYGFLSEDASFARRCVHAGLTFIGPPAEAIALMGDKAAAKRWMLEARVPCVPGAQPAEQTPEAFAAAAARVGFPLLVKAVAGGGGRGLRVVREPAELGAALASASREAQSAFGRGDLMLEQLLEGARHVEIQVFADTHGAVVHLGERECSLQRRHQKIVEEAPSPAVDPALRERMGRAAVAAAKAIGYVGAGTVEFLLAPDGSFFFIEMNTRLQVEHPVTELVTGLDLVEWQLRVAAGEPLPLRQEEIAFQGHAIEARLNAEDPSAGFLPQAGPVLRWRAPDRIGVRVDAGLAEGFDVSPFYDPMVSNIVAHGPTREVARRRLVAALEETVLLGPLTNRRFLIDLLASTEFEAGAIATDTLDARYRAAPPARPDLPPWLWALGAFVHLLPESFAADPWRSTGEAELTLVLAEEQAPSPRALRLRWSSVRMEVGVGETTASVRLLERRDAGLRCEVDGLAFEVQVARLGARTLVQARGLEGRFEEVVLPGPSNSERAVGTDSLGNRLVVAPMSGRVLSVAAQVGRPVAKGELLVVIEAMKMEHRLLAPCDGELLELRVGEGAQVAARAVVAVLAPGAAGQGGRDVPG